MARPLFALEKPVVSVPIDGTVMNAGDPIYNPDQVGDAISEDQLAEWVHRYKDGSPRNIGAICSACDMWNGMMTPCCPWCGRIMKNAMYTKRGEYIGKSNGKDISSHGE